MDPGIPLFYNQLASGLGHSCYSYSILTISLLYYLRNFQPARLLTVICKAVGVAPITMTEATAPPPLDLSHHLSYATKNKKPSSVKDFYKYFTIPGIANLTGGNIPLAIDLCHD